MYANYSEIINKSLEGVLHNKYKEVYKRTLIACLGVKLLERSLKDKMTEEDRIFFEGANSVIGSIIEVATEFFKDNKMSIVDVDDFKKLFN